MSKAKRKHIRRNRRRRAILRWAEQAARWLIDERPDFAPWPVELVSREELIRRYPMPPRETPEEAFRDAQVFGVGILEVKP